MSEEDKRRQRAREKEFEEAGDLFAKEEKWGRVFFLGLLCLIWGTNVKQMLSSSTGSRQWWLETRSFFVLHVEIIGSPNRAGARAGEPASSTMFVF